MADPITQLSPSEEAAFQRWVQQNGIADVDRAPYDYRGYFKEYGDQPIRFGEDHFTDTYKQHGHPTFSVESQYSEGPHDGGRWRKPKTLPAPLLSELGFNYVPTGADLMSSSRGSRLDPRLIREALTALMGGQR